MSLPTEALVDTNVPKIANLATDPAFDAEVPLACVMACVEAVQHVVRTRGLVIDAGDEIYDEYRRQLSLKGQPGVGDLFMKWVHDNRWKLPESNRVPITKNGDSYNEFPIHDGLTNFDRSDRKFVATACAHPHKPPILQAADSKWWGWQDALADVGITVNFLCPEYIRIKYAEKIQN